MKKALIAAACGIPMMAHAYYLGTMNSAFSSEETYETVYAYNQGGNYVGAWPGPLEITSAVQLSNALSTASSYSNVTYGDARLGVSARTSLGSNELSLAQAHSIAMWNDSFLVTSQSLAVGSLVPVEIGILLKTFPISIFNTYASGQTELTAENGRNYGSGWSPISTYYALWIDSPGFSKGIEVYGYQDDKNEHYASTIANVTVGDYFSIGVTVDLKANACAHVLSEGACPFDYVSAQEATIGPVIALASINLADPNTDYISISGFRYAASFTNPSNHVPEPGSLPLVLAGLAFISFSRASGNKSIEH